MTSPPVSALLDLSQEAGKHEGKESPRERLWHPHLKRWPDRRQNMNVENIRPLPHVTGLIYTISMRESRRTFEEQENLCFSLETVGLYIGQSGGTWVFLFVWRAEDGHCIICLPGAV